MSACVRIHAYTHVHTVGRTRTRTHTFARTHIYIYGLFCLARSAGKMGGGAERGTRNTIDSL